MAAPKTTEEKIADTRKRKLEAAFKAREAAKRLDDRLARLETERAKRLVGELEKAYRAGVASKDFKAFLGLCERHWPADVPAPAAGARPPAV